MSVPDYRHLVKELMERTEKNFKIIKENGPYEVTQLINSLYCFFVVPCECFMDVSSPEFSIDESTLESKEYEILVDKLSNYSKETDPTKSYIRIRDLKDFKEHPMMRFVKSMRNAISHEGFGFLPVSESKSFRPNKITHLIFISEYKGSPNFIAKFSLFELEELVALLTKIFKKHEDFIPEDLGLKYAIHYSRIKDNVTHIFYNGF